MGIEVVFDGTLAGMGHQHDVADTGGDRFIDDVLNNGAIHDGDHLLGNRLGCRQTASAETGHGQNGLADHGAFLVSR